MKAAIAVVAALFLSGCSGMGYVVSEYGNVDRMDWQNGEGTTFRVYDRPQDGKLMITPSIGASAVQGITYGATRNTGLVYEAAANEWLAAQGRGNCKAVRTVNILDPQHEVYYECA